MPIKPIKALTGLKSTKPFHTPNSPKANVNLDGSGVRQKVGKKVSSYMDNSIKSVKSYGPKKQTLA